MSTAQGQQNEPRATPTKSITVLLLLNAILLSLGSIGGPLLLRLYFIHGGSLMWLSTLTQVCGWPLLLPPIYLSSFSTPTRRHPFFSLPTLALLYSSLLGLVFGLSGYMYAYGSSYLPLSTSSILFATQLAFTSLFAFLLVRQKFDAYVINSIVLLTVGPGLLGFGSSGDRPEGESDGKYYLGFALTVAASGLMGLFIPLMERVYGVVNEGYLSYGVVMEIQVVVGLFATCFCLVGMLANHEFQAISREASEFGLGKMKYYLVLGFDTLFWQFINLGLFGVISSSSSLLAGILIAVLLPVGEISAVICFHERFNGNKGVALALCLWGFSSYLYGEMKRSRKLKKMKEVEISASMP